jgi:hypothetical protein
MFTIIWNLHSFHIVDKLPNDIKMKSDYFVTKILSPLEQAIFIRGRDMHQKIFVIHIDNCSVHTSRASTYWLDEHGMHRMLHLLYSLDLTSSDFYLFSVVKEKLERIHVCQDD